MGTPNFFPDDAQRAYKGTIYEIWQWPQKMFDGSTVMFEGLRRPNTVEVIATAGDKILIEEQEQPGREGAFICPPGGRVDEGEEPLEAAKRELFEETGYASDDWQLWHTDGPSGKVDWTIYTYVARNCRKASEQHLDAGEKITVRLVPFDEFLQLSDEPRFRGRELVEQLLRARLDPAKKEALRLALGISD